MNFASLLLDALRGLVLLGVALTAHAIMRRSAASVRQIVLTAALVSVAVAPLSARAIALSRAMPVVEIAAFSVHPFAEPEGVEIAPPEVPGISHLAEARPLRDASQTPSSNRINWRAWLVAGWTLGAALILVRLVAGIWGARRLARGARREMLSPFAGVIARTSAEARAFADVAISDAVESPVVTGILRPIVLMPRSALDWSMTRWRVVLLHELAHVRRRDCLVGVFSQVVCALHWFDPLVWLTRSRWRKECELAADEAVLTAGVQPSDYAEHLLAVAAAMDIDASVAGLAMASELSNLAHRVETIVSEVPKRRASMPMVFSVISTAFMLTLALACAGPSDSGPIASSSPGAVRAADSAPPSFLGVNACEQPEVAHANLADLVAQRTGSPVDRNELTIDPRLQGVADEEVARAVTTFRARTATAIILDPGKGEILAVANPDAARQNYITGSTMKSLTIAAALDAKLVRVDQKFDCRPRPSDFPSIHDANVHDSLELGEILEVSSSVGALRVYQALGDERFHRALKQFHFGDEKSPIELCFRPFSPSQTGGHRFAPPVEESAVGEGFVSSPLQMIAAYSVFANGGEYVAPTLVRTIRDVAGGVVWRHAPVREPVLRYETAKSVMEMLELAVDGPRATGKAARLPRVRVAGKTGTSGLDEPDAKQLYASFVGIVPADAPRYVILVGVVDPRDGGGGGMVAAPTFARIAARALSL